MNIFALVLPPRSNRLRLAGLAESRAVDSVDRGQAAAGHHGYRGVLRRHDHKSPSNPSGFGA
ncbi:MAG: hypothetical protein AAGB46_16640 [Verrucomicrobiota bacterium]